MTKEFPREELQEMVRRNSATLIRVEHSLRESTRWSLIYDIIFQDTTDGKYYESSYSVGATEYQDEMPYEYDDDIIKCDEVESKEVVVKKWVRK